MSKKKRGKRSKKSDLTLSQLFEQGPPKVEREERSNLTLKQLCEQGPPKVERKEGETDDEYLSSQKYAYHEWASECGHFIM